MPILFSLVACGTNVLARYAVCAGNFLEVAEQVLSKVACTDASQQSYSHSSYLFHYITEDGITYLCISDDGFPRETAFGYLGAMSKRFKSDYGTNLQSTTPYSMNQTFAPVMASQMKHFSNTNDDRMSKLRTEVNDVKIILGENIESLASRGERLELLINKTENLNNQAVSFRTGSRSLSRKLMWNNIKLIVYIIIGIGISIYIIGAMACGLSWQACIKN